MVTQLQEEEGPTLLEASKVWAKIGFLSFGGPAAQIALMHKAIVQEKGWLSEQRYLAALSFCMLLPGPEAMQLATYAGWRLHGTLGGLIAGSLFVLPGACIVLALGMIYAVFGDVPLVSALFYGVKAAVLVIVLEALIKVAKRALLGSHHWLIAGLAFIGIFFLALPFPLIVLFAGLYGFATMGKSAGTTLPQSNTVSWVSTCRTIVTWLVVWWLPMLLLVVSGVPDILEQIGYFFSTLAVVTFGGAYAVLAFMAQDVVGSFGWLTAGEMMDGLGLAETTPGPLILVTEFVAFLAAYKEGGLALGIAGALVALWVTFAPCFLWIFAGGPYLDWISAQPRLRGALAAITAAVVGVILNLSIWFALHVLFAEVTHREIGFLHMWQPNLASIELLAVALALMSAVLAFRFGWGILRILATSSLLGAFVILVV